MGVQQVSLAQEVTRRREARGWTREDLASATRGLVSKTTIVDIELGNTLKPRPATMRALATALQCSEDELLGRAPIPAPAPDNADEIRLLEDYRTLTVEHRAALQTVLRALVQQQQQRRHDQG